MQVCYLGLEVLVFLGFHLKLLDKVIDLLGISLFGKLHVFLLETLESLLELQKLLLELLEVSGLLHLKRPLPGGPLYHVKGLLQLPTPHAG
jgi:hypothetical protein